MARLSANHGLRHKRTTWYRDLDDVTIVVGFQKSYWADCYYLNVGYWFQQIEEQREPRAVDCHIYGRGEDVLGAEQPLTDLLDMRVQMPEEDRAAGLERTIGQVLDRLVEFGSVSALATGAGPAMVRLMLVIPPARALLNQAAG